MTLLPPRDLRTSTHAHPKDWTRESAHAHLRDRHNRVFLPRYTALDELAQIHRILHEQMGERV